MIELEYNNGRIEVKYRIKGQEIVLTVDEMIAHISDNGTINERVGFIVPFLVYFQARDIARKIDEAIESRQGRRF